MSNHTITVLNLPFHITRAWRCPLRDIRLDHLKDLFSEFCKLFPDHPHEENTEVWLLYNYGAKDQPSERYSLLWCCDHFEHSSDDDIQALALFMRHFAYFSEDRFSNLTLFHGNLESVMFDLNNPTKTVIDHIKQYGTEETPTPTNA